MDKEILEIIVRILSGDASQEDKQRLIGWLGHNPENMKTFGHLESIWNALEIMASGKEYNAGEAHERFKTKTSDKITVRGRSRFKQTIDWCLRIAAILVIVTGLSYLMMKSERADSITDTAVYEVIAPRGSKAQVMLPDGSRVWLNADSKIKYRKDFNEESRDIFLEGEAYFEVAKNPGKPFIVTTANIRIRALGTAFNVKSYPGESTIETTLIEGKVVVEKILANSEGEKLLTLEPNQKVIYYKNPGSYKEILVDDENVAQKPILPLKSIESQIKLNDKVKPEQDIAWKNNRWYFENESFQSLAVKLERRFRVNIHFLNDEIKEYPFSGKFDDIIIERMLVALQFASPFYYTITDKDIYISNKPIKDIPISNKKIDN